VRALACVALVFTSACTEPIERSRVPEPPQVVSTVPFTPPAGFQVLRLGLVPYLSAETIRATHQHFADTLAARLGVPVEMIVGDSYEDTVERLARGEFDLVELSPYALARAEGRVSLRCLVQSISDGSVTAASYLFVRDDSPLQSLADVRGARVGFVDRTSTSGFLYPLKLLKAHGLDPTKEPGAAHFYGNHEAVLLAVLDGGVDVGATYQGSFEALKRARGIDPRAFRVIAKTQRTPHDVLCATQQLPPVVADALQQILLSIDSRERVGRETLSPMSVNGYQPFDDRAYDGVRQAARELGDPAP
jgi:phosphonate transport system substrate-binding protein